MDQLIVQLQATDAVLMWDALVDIEHGIAQSAHVVILDGGGRSRRHCLGGYRRG